MSAAKSSMIMAFLALFVCLSSTVMAAELYEPGNPFNCTTFQANCKALGVETYGNGKNASFSSASAQCNVSNIANAKPLCGLNVVCTASFVIQVQAPAPGVTTTTSSAAVPTATVNGTSPTTAPKPPVTGGTNGVFTVASADLTPQLLAKYNLDHCAKSAANVKMATSIAAMVAVASIVSFMSSLL
ncbi:hypothetical protein BGZ96_005554 [Linnemannia gamsii]|uniref:Uncharacterized protein n=1 Tax=Linnemannia gamsii TaxID=64522 RepID=A0ABQ7K3X3_9FUNG|nr:hypothetical protein BGZ96_005554 [Linnemannia gamsii]